MKPTIAIAAALLALPLATEAAPVTWNFYETGCSGPCILPMQPFVLASLTLPGPTSIGSAEWSPGPRDPSIDPGVPTHTGDDFTLSIPAGKLRLSPSSGYMDPPCIGGPACISDEISSYRISWTEAAGNLNAVLIDFLTLQDEVRLGFGNLGPLNLHEIASDLGIGGCSLGPCSVTGVWVDPADGVVAQFPVREPASWLMLAMSLLVWGWVMPAIASAGRYLRTATSEV